jgi:predicted phosphodiesterase
LTTRTVGVIGDVHCEAEALEAALAHLASLGPELVLCVGDIVDGTGNPDRCCELLREAGALTVCGNHERWLFEGAMRELPGATPLEALHASNREYLGGLPKTYELDTVSGRALLCHGLGEHDMAAVRPDDRGYALENNDTLQALIHDGRYAFVINGHTHQRMVRRVGALTVINAGTLHRDDNPCFAFVDFERERTTFFELCPGDGVVSAEERRLADWTELF